MSAGGSSEQDELALPNTQALSSLENSKHPQLPCDLRANRQSSETNLEEVFRLVMRGRSDNVNAITIA